MRGKLWIITFLVCLACPVFATRQYPDRIVYEGVLYDLQTSKPNKVLPLDALWPNRADRPDLSEGPDGMMSTACYRGYKAIWQVEGATLYLAALDAWQGDKKADLKEVFPKRYENGKVKADWFSGSLTLTVARGGDVILVFEDGKLAWSPEEVVRCCPAGHTTIKLVPVTYGRIEMTPELREKEENLDIAFGGCSVGKYGKFKIACETCGAHTFDGPGPWYDKTTMVIPSGDAIKGLDSEYRSRLATEKTAKQELEASGLQVNVKLLTTGDLAEWAKENGKAPLEVITGVSDTRFAAGDADLAPLAHLSDVTYLSLSGSKVTDAGLSYMSGLKKLRTLYVGDTRVTDAGLKHITGLPELRELWLRGTRVTDAGMASLGKLTNLASLLLDRTSLTDEGVRHLKNLKSMQSLGLSQTKITDAGLAHLKGMSNLQFLNLYDTGVTDAGVAELTQALPELRIILDPPPTKH